jgi:hypothetical protein
MSNPVSLQGAINEYESYRPISAEMVALKLGMNAPISLTNMAGQLNGMATTTSFNQNWTTRGPRSAALPSRTAT